MSQYRKSYSSRRPSSGGRPQGNRRPQQARRGPKKENLHPSKYVKQANPRTEEEYTAEHTFADFDVVSLLKENIVRKGFETPSPIQDQIIPTGLQGRDVIGIANTGTGKTVAFALPVLNQLIKDKQSNALIITPTRELAEQVLDECKSLSSGGRVYWSLLIGGMPITKQFKDLARRPNLVIGTPGRIKDHIERGTLKLEHFDMVVLDEVDRMLDMGFVTDVRTILSQIPSSRQSFFFSATMDTRVRTLIDEFSINPVEVSVKTGDTSDNVEQNVVMYGDIDDKIEKLHEVLLADEVTKVLIFDETRRHVERLAKKLQDRGFNADSIHGGRSQGQRKRALSSFKTNDTLVLVATDVAARGIDVDGITHVINYATPQSYSDYVHRIGRAGRAGKKGYALTFLER